MHLRLVESVHLNFHRIFNGQNIYIRLVQNGHGSIKRRRFSGTRRSGSQNNSIRKLEGMAQIFQSISGNSQFFKRGDFFRLILNTHHDLFPVNRRKAGDTKIQFTSFLRRDLSTSILRNALLINFQVGHNLNTGNHRGVNVGRVLHNATQRSINTVTNLNGVLQRFNVNIRRTQVNGVRDSVHYQLRNISSYDGILNGLEFRIHRDKLKFLRKVSIHRDAGFISSAEFFRVGDGHIFDTHQTNFSFQRA